MGKGQKIGNSSINKIEHMSSFSERERDWTCFDRSNGARRIPRIKNCWEFRGH